MTIPGKEERHQRRAKFHNRIHTGYMYMLCLEYKVSWVRVPPEAVFSLPWVCCVALPCLFDLLSDEKEGRKKQARSHKQGKATQHTQGLIYMFLNER